MSVKVITEAGTVTLTGRAAHCVDVLASVQREMDGIEFGSLEFHFAPTRVNVKLVRSIQQKL